MRGSTAALAINMAILANLALGCSNLPTSGPSSSQIQDYFAGSRLNPLGAYLVELAP